MANDNDARFEGIFKRLPLGLDVRMAEIRRIFPSKADRVQYFDWVNRRSRDRVRAWNTPKMTRSELLKRIDNDRLTTQYRDLVAALNHDIVPSVPLGYSGDWLFRLIPDASHLLRHQADLRPTSYEVLPPCFLGLNDDVQPKLPAVPLSRRRANRSDISTKSAESDDMAGGFVFLQLGALEWAKTTAKPPSSAFSELGVVWQASGFHVVARLAQNGHIDGIYVVFDMFPEDEITYQRDQYMGADWGMWPDGRQFSYARIGSRMRCFEEDRELVPTEPLGDYVVELVRAVVRPNGCPLRISVAE